MAKNIFILALDPFNLKLLQRIHEADQFRFHSLLDYDDLVFAKEYSMQNLLEKAENQLNSFSGSVDGLFTYWDFPSSTMAPILRKNFELPGPSPESVLGCEHKYWSRVLQKQAIPELTPSFCLVNPFLDNPLEDIDIPFPFWLKPIRAHSSHLGYRIENETDFLRALEEIRKKLPRYAEAFNVLLSMASIPADIASIDGYHCIAEGIIQAGHQCTLEGYVYEGQPRVYGIIDSVRDYHRSCFSRYQYPSFLPEDVRTRMREAAAKIMRHIGFDNGPFNIEFFYDESNGRISLLEINARISKSHCPLFEMVEGSSHHEVAVNLAVGKEPQYPTGEGRFSCAVKFMLRHFQDAKVKTVPGQEQINQIKKEMPETQIRIEVKPGDRLSDLPEQDSYSYEYAVLFIGGRDLRDVEKKYKRCRELFQFEFDQV